MTTMILFVVVVWYVVETWIYFFLSLQTAAVDGEFLVTTQTFVLAFVEMSS